jgi:hypothetical protein
MSHARALIASILRKELGPPYSDFDLIPLPRAEVVRLRARYPRALAGWLELVQRAAGAEPARAKTTKRRTPCPR